MFEPLRNLVLRLMRVPHEPTPPVGAAGSVRVFRAGRSLYKLRLLSWGIGQVGALFGIIVSLTFLGRLERSFDETKHELQAAKAARTAPASTASEDPAMATPRASAASVAPAKANANSDTNATVVDPAKKPAPAVGKGKQPSEPRQRTRSGLNRVVEHSPSWIFIVVMFFEGLGIAIYLIQIPITYAMVRLDYELRWYIVTDRSLRIRTGIATVQESTMSFANVQQVEVLQGPLQRLLGLADVRVQSAGGGGGGGDKHHASAGDSLHTGVFHGVNNADEIRDLILARLRKFRETGLGDPDEPAAKHTHAEAMAVASAVSSSPSARLALAAAQELLQEARTLRAALGASQTN